MTGDGGETSATHGSFRLRLLRGYEFARAASVSLFLTEVGASALPAALLAVAALSYFMVSVYAKASFYLKEQLLLYVGAAFVWRHFSCWRL